MSRISKRSSLEHISEFDRGRIVAYSDRGLSFKDIGNRVGRKQLTVMRVCNCWMQEGAADRSHFSRFLSGEDYFCSRVNKMDVEF